MKPANPPADGRSAAGRHQDPDEREAHEEEAEDRSDPRPAPQQPRVGLREPEHALAGLKLAIDLRPQFPRDHRREVLLHANARMHGTIRYVKHERRRDCVLP
jgi:hypothetical protein